MICYMLHDFMNKSSLLGKKNSVFFNFPFFKRHSKTVFAKTVLEFSIFKFFDKKKTF